MRKIALFLALFLTTFSFSQNINIPDVNFKNALLEHGVTIVEPGVSKIDTNNDGEIQVTEATTYGYCTKKVCKAKKCDLSITEKKIHK